MRFHVWTAGFGVFVGSGRQMLFGMDVGIVAVVVWTAMRSKDQGSRWRAAGVALSRVPSDER